MGMWCWRWREGQSLTEIEHSCLANGCVSSGWVIGEWEEGRGVRTGCFGLGDVLAIGDLEEGVQLLR